MNSPVAWTLAVHVIGIVFWMGGLLVVTQVLASHIRETSPEARQALARLEQKLLKGVAHPGAAITVITGLGILRFEPDYLQQGWLHLKLLLVLILIGLDLFITVRVRAYQAGRIVMPARQAKLFHGATALLFIAIVILVMIKP